MEASHPSPPPHLPEPGPPLPRGGADLRDADAFLLDREIAGLRAIIYGRVLFLSVNAFFALALATQSRAGVRTATLALLTGLSALVILWSRRCLARRRHVTLCGTVGSVNDVLLLAALPWVWYLASGGGGREALPLAFLLKFSPFLPVCFALLVINGFAVRTRYPLIIVGGVVLIQGVLFLVARSDPRTRFSSHPLEHMIGPAVSPLALLIATLTFVITGLALAFHLHQERRRVLLSASLERNRLKLSQYFSPAVFAQIERGPEAGPGEVEALHLPEAVVLFSDLRGFTALSSQLSPAEVVASLRDYHSYMVEVITEHGGTLDKYIGDGMMVIFGLPTPREDEAVWAVRAALAMHRALAVQNTGRAARGLPALAHAIGIHCGPVIAGNIGARAQLEYTVIGDTVNVASRVEGLCRVLGEDLLVTAEVAKRLRSRSEEFHLVDRGEQQLRGREEAVRVHAVHPVSAPVL